MIEVKVQSLGIDQVSSNPVVILQELEGKRTLPIWIGPVEARAIAMELAGMKYSRPLTHDLAASLIRGLGGSLVRVQVTSVQDSTYFAELVIQRGAEVFSIDARPSDSIAIALRLKSRIFASETLLSEYLQTESAAEAAGEEPWQKSSDAPEEAEGGSPLSAEQLQEYLKKLNPEDLGRFNP